MSSQRGWQRRHERRCCSCPFTWSDVISPASHSSKASPRYMCPGSAVALSTSNVLLTRLTCTLHHSCHCVTVGKPCYRHTAHAKPLAETLIQKVRKLLPPQATTLRAPRVHYKCEQLGTDGVLEFGYLWRLDEKEPKLMSECSGTYGM